MNVVMMVDMDIPICLMTSGSPDGDHFFEHPGQGRGDLFSCRRQHGCMASGCGETTQRCEKYSRRDRSLRHPCIAPGVGIWGIRTIRTARPNYPCNPGRSTTQFPQGDRKLAAPRIRPALPAGYPTRGARSTRLSPDRGRRSETNAPGNLSSAARPQCTQPVDSTGAGERSPPDRHFS